MATVFAIQEIMLKMIRLTLKRYGKVCFGDVARLNEAHNPLQNIHYIEAHEEQFTLLQGVNILMFALHNGEMFF